MKFLLSLSIASSLLFCGNCTSGICQEQKDVTDDGVSLVNETEFFRTLQVSIENKLLDMRINMARIEGKKDHENFWYFLWGQISACEYIKTSLQAYDNNQRYWNEYAEKMNPKTEKI